MLLHKALLAYYFDIFKSCPKQLLRERRTACVTFVCPLNCDVPHTQDATDQLAAKDSTQIIDEAIASSLDKISSVFTHINHSAVILLTTGDASLENIYESVASSLVFMCTVSSSLSTANLSEFRLLVTVDLIEQRENWVKYFASNRTQSWLFELR